MKRFLRDVSLSAVMAGFIAVLVGYTSSVVIIFAAAQALGASADETHRDAAILTFIVTLSGLTLAGALALLVQHAGLGGNRR